MRSIADFSVVMTGASSKTRRAAAALIDKALRDQGFNNIDVLDTHGDYIDLPEEPLSALESLRRASPKLLDAFVTIQEVKVRDYGQTYFEETTMPRSDLN